MSGNAHMTNTTKAVIPAAQAWGLSPAEWLAFEQDLATEDDYERWITEMEAEASEAAKPTADLSLINAPF
jgi:hypothetical protein